MFVNLFVDDFIGSFSDGYEIINKKIHEHLRSCKDEFHVDQVALLGGIIINTDYGLDDYFDARNFEVIDIKSL